MSRRPGKKGGKADEASSGATEGLTADETSKAESRLSKFATRCIAGLAMVFGSLSVIYAGHGWVIIMVMLVQVQVFREMLAVRYKQAKEKEIPLFRTTMWVWFFVAMQWSYGGVSVRLLKIAGFIQGEAQALRYHTWISFGLYSAVFVVTVATMRKGSVKYQIGQLCWTIVTLCMVVLQTDSITTNIFRGLWWFVFPLSLVITNDVFAYFTGFCIGRKFTKRPFLPFISPNKTWEGFVGGLVFTCVFGMFVPLLANYTWAQWFICPATPRSGVNSLATLFVPSPKHVLRCEMPLIFQPASYEVGIPRMIMADASVSLQLMPMQIHGLGLAIYASLVAPWGGFFASAIKRAYNKKDFDSFIPGHGGLTDRMDCQFIMALAAFVHYNTFVRATGGESLLHTSDEIMQAVGMLALDQQQELYAKLGAALGVGGG
jgi:phosphatidate cytidylyltransferase